MRSLRFILPLLLVFGVQSFGRSQSESPDDIRLTITKNVMNEISQDELGSVRNQFSPDLKDSLTEAEMRVEITELTRVAGTFQKQISQTTRSMQGRPIYVSRCQFEKFKVELKLVFNDENQITDVWLLPVSDLTAESMESMAKDIPSLLREERYDEVNAQFNDRMKVTMPTERLHESWAHVVSHLGPFKSVRVARKDPEFDAVDVRCEFENGPMIVRIAFDPAGKIGGLWMLPAEPERDSQI
jgi:hypothetical protein